MVIDDNGARIAADVIFQFGALGREITPHRREDPVAANIIFGVAAADGCSWEMIFMNAVLSAEQIVLFKQAAITLPYNPILAHLPDCITRIGFSGSKAQKVKTSRKGVITQTLEDRFSKAGGKMMALPELYRQFRRQTLITAGVLFAGGSLVIFVTRESAAGLYAAIFLLLCSILMVWYLRRS